MSFPGPLGSKRRRMRSGGSVTANPTEIVEEGNISEQKTTQTSKCKGASTIPIFLKKTYKMVDTCDPSMAAWTDDGEMFVVKDPDLFASEVIPQYFDHNKNFYGFRKMQAKPIKNSDYDAGTSKHVTFFNENFKRGRCDLLKKIQRSTRGGGNATNPTDQNKEVTALKEQVARLEAKVADLEAKTEERVRRLELDMLSRMEQMMMAAHSQLSVAASVGENGSVPFPPPPQLDNQGALLGRGSSINSAVNSVADAVAAGGGVFASPRNSFAFPGSVTFPASVNAGPAVEDPMAAPTLPPHPKQKQLPSGILPIGNSMPAPPNRFNSLRGISALRSISGLSRGLSVDSTGSPLVMRTAWEDKLFSQIMLGENGEQEVTETVALENPNFVSNDTVREPAAAAMEDDNMSDVSNPDMR